MLSLAPNAGPSRLFELQIGGIHKRIFIHQT
jgi:hypothetical protein